MIAVASAVAVAAGSLVVGQVARAEARAGENIRLGADPRAVRGIDTPNIAVNPANPLHMVESDNDFLLGQCDFHVTFDGGATWTGGHLTAPADFPNPPCQPNPFDSGGYGHTNGSIAFGSGQNVYTTFSSKVGPPQRPENGTVVGPADSILVAKSTDGGRTFGTAVVAVRGPAEAQPFYIRPKLTVLPRPSGDQVLVAGWGVKVIPGTGAQGGTGYPGTDTQRRAVTTVSNDGGATWSPLVDASAPGEQIREVSTPVLASNGSAWVAFRNRDTGAPVAPSTAPVPLPNPIVVARTTNGGATWTESSTTLIPIAGGHPELARDPGNGNLYVVYQQATPYPNATAPANTTCPPMASPQCSNDQDIYLQRSTDNGVTWSTPRRINDDPIGGQLQGAGIPQTQPFVTVSSSGRVDVVWHDRRLGYPGSTLVSAETVHGSAARRQSDVYMASSTDGATSFSPNRRVTDRSMNLDLGLEGEVGGSTWYGPGAAPAGPDSLVVSLPDSREGNFDTESNDIYLTTVNTRPTDLTPVRNLGQQNPPSASVALSRLAYPGGGEPQSSTAVTKVVVVNESDGPSALIGSVLARDGWGPVLLSPSAGLPTDVKAEVSRMGPVGAYVIGGTSTLSSTVVSDVQTAGALAAPTVRRIAGANGAENAKTVAEILDTRSNAQKDANAPAFPAVVVVNPASPEAAAAAGLAASRRLPVLFVDQNAVPAATTLALTQLAIPKTFVIGGTSAVSDTVKDALPSPTRLSGGDLYATSEAVVAEARAQGSPANVVYVAAGDRPVDAAVLGSAVARLGGVLLLSPSAGTTYNASLQRLGLGQVTDRVVVQLPLGLGNGYRTVGSDGGIFSFGNLGFLGSTGGTPLESPVVGMAHTPSRAGYWTVAADGGIFAFGDAPFKGSTGGTPLAKPVVGMTPTPTGQGYWLVASDGGIFAFGDAEFFGSTGGTPLNKPVVGLSATPTGKGYWLVASDGGIFAYGDAAFKGSTGGVTLDKPVVGMASTPAGNGYWLVASDGGIFAYGDATFKGSTGGTPLTKPIVGMAPTPTGGGYRLVASDGGIFAFGDAGFFGSTGGIPLDRPIVGMAS